MGSLNLGLEKNLWRHGCKSHVYKLLPIVGDLLMTYRDPLRLLADTCWEFMVAKGDLTKQQRKLKAKQKNVCLQERRSRAAQNEVDADEIKLRGIARAAAIEEASADADAKQTARAAAHAANVKSKWKVNQRSAEIAHGQSSAALH